MEEGDHEPRKDVILLALKMEEGDHEWLLETEKKGNQFYCKASRKEHNPANPLIFAL